MGKRIAATGLWFVAVWMTYGMTAYFAGLPELGGALVGGLAAAVVWIDPTGRLWAIQATASGKPTGLLTGDRQEVARSS